GVELVLERVHRHGVSALHLGVEGRGGVGSTRDSSRRRVAVADLDERVRERSLRVLRRLAEAEGAVHGVAIGEVHFHELGAADTLVDVVGTVTLLEALGVARLEWSPLPYARGLVETEHGVLPLPAPATAALLVGTPVVGVELEAELVTPTGAALAAALVDRFGAVPAMTIDRIGYGAGTADFAERPNVVRVLLGGRAAAIGAAGEVTLLETNLDDLLPELVPDAVERCYAAGALDVWTAPVAMKKGRPGIVLSALARPDAEAAVARAILEETTALGVRAARLQRYELEREERVVEIAGRAVRVKLGRLDGRIVNVAP